MAKSINRKWFWYTLTFIASVAFGRAYWLDDPTHETVHNVVIAARDEAVLHPSPVVPSNRHKKGIGSYKWEESDLEKVHEAKEWKKRGTKTCSEIPDECVEVNGKKLYSGLAGRSDYSFTASSEEELKENALNSLLEEYSADYEDRPDIEHHARYDFTGSYPAEVLSIKPTPSGKGHSYYLVFRDQKTNEITAFGDYAVVARDGDKEYLRAHHQSLATAYTDDYLQMIQRKREDVKTEVKQELSMDDLTASYPPLSEEKARGILQGYMKEVGISPETATVEWNRYAIIYAYNPPLNDYYQAGFETSHEFIINGKHKVWVDMVNGKVVDGPQLEWIAEKNEWIYRWNPTDEEVFAQKYERKKIYNE